MGERVDLMEIKTITCWYCGSENEYDPDNDVIECEDCGSLIFISEEEKQEGQHE